MPPKKVTVKSDGEPEGTIDLNELLQKLLASKRDADTNMATPLDRAGLPPQRAGGAAGSHLGCHSFNQVDFFSDQLYTFTTKKEVFYSTHMYNMYSKKPLFLLTKLNMKSI